MRILLVFGLTSVSSALMAQNLTVIDDNFNNYGSDYTATIVVPPDPDVNYSYIQNDQINVPPANTFGAIYHIHDVPRDDDTSLPLNTQEVGVQSIIRKDNVFYDPVASGKVASLDFRIDYRTNDPFSEIYFFIQRSGNGAAAGFTPIIANGQWQTLNISGLLASDFGGLDYEGNIPYRFGFGFLSSGTPDSMSTDPLEYIMNVDNFRVIVTPVPEPGVAALLLGTIMMSLRRRR